MIYNVLLIFAVQQSNSVMCVRVCVCVCVCAHACVLSHFSHVQFFVTLWTIAPQAALSMGFSRQGYWIGLPGPASGDLPDPGIEPVSPALAGSLPTSATWKAYEYMYVYVCSPS